MTDQDKVEEFLEHFGVKGMKWGVRKRRSAAENLSTNARTNGRDAYPGMSTKRSGHAGSKLSTSKPKKKLVRNMAMDYATSGFAKRQRARSAKKTLLKLERVKPTEDTFRGRRKQRKIDEAKYNAAFQYALAKPRKHIYVTQNGQVSALKGKKFAKVALSRRPVAYDDIRLTY